MSVVLTSPVCGQPVGSTYDGELAAWLLEYGYAQAEGTTYQPPLVVPVIGA